MLEPQQPAPDFELENQDGEPVKLSDFAGQPVVLYFYPKADTPGCTVEAQGFRDHWDAFVDEGVAVLGVSNDPVADLKAFQEKYDLPITLLSDVGGDVASTYETFGTTEVRGETWEIAFRNTYLVDADGIIASVYEDVDPDGHAEEVLAELAAA